MRVPVSIMVLAALALVPVPVARAGAGIDFTQTLAGLDGKPMIECKQAGADGKGCAATGPVTLGEVCAGALMMPERGGSIDDQIRRARLAQKVLDGKAVALTAEDTKRIEDQVAKMGLSPIVVLDVVKAIDPAAAAQP